MKRFRVLALTAAMALAFSGVAAAKTQPIQVILNGSPVSFAAEPVALDGRTFVEFRSLFKELGYDVVYTPATKKITAKSNGRTIELTIGADAAFVDGKAVPIDNQLRTVNNRTLVGVKFIATLSGKDVRWDAAAKTVIIEDKGPTAGQQAAVFALLDKVVAAEAASDVEATVALFTDDSPLKEPIRKALEEQRARVKTKTTIVKKEIQSYSAQEVVLTTVEESVKIGGDGFYPNNRSSVTYTLHPGANGEWKIYSVQIDETAYTNVQELFKQAAGIPADEEAAIKAVVEAQLAASNEENLEAYLATMFFDDSSLKETAAEQIKQIFAAYESKITIEKLVIADYNGSDKATVLIQALNEVQVAGQTVKARTTIANEAVKKDGKWLLSPSALQLGVEQL